MLAGAAAGAVGPLFMREGILFDIRAGLFAGQVLDAASGRLSTLSDS